MLDIAQVPILLRPSRTKQVALLVICLAFTVGGALMARGGEKLGYFCSLFFGLGFCLLVANMSPNAAYLRIEQDGFTVCSLFRARTVPWSAVEEFGTFQLKSTRMVAWNYVSSYKTKAGLRGLNRGLTGFEAALPDTYGFKATDLAEQMEALRVRYSQGRDSSVVLLNGQVQL
jgi:hypothetical protein